METHYIYEIRVNHKSAKWSVNKKDITKAYKETTAKGIIEFWQLKNGYLHKLIDLKKN